MTSRRNGFGAGLVGALWWGASIASAQQPPSVQADEAMQGGGMTEERLLADEQARLHFRAGIGLYDAGRFPQAAEEFEEAYRLSERPELLFNAYVAYRDATDTEGAVRSLERYLGGSRSIPDRVNLEARLRSMRDALAEQRTRATLLEENQRRLADAERTERGGGGEAWPWVVAGAGGAMAVAGAVLGGVALGEADALVAQCPNGECALGVDLEGVRSTARSMALASDVLLFGGGALALTGLVLGVVLASSGSSEETPTVSASCGPTGCAASLRSRF